MNNTLKMQILADELNEKGRELYPEYEWEILKDPNVPDIITDNIDSMCPSIHLVRKDGKEINKTSAAKISGALVSSKDNISCRFLVLYPQLANGKNTVVIEAAKKYMEDREEITLEYIKEMSANYGKNLEEIEGTWRSVQKIADTLNKIGKLHHLGYSFAVKEAPFSHDPMIDVVPSTIRSKVQSITKHETPSIMLEELQKAFKSEKIYLGNLGKRILFRCGDKFDDKDIAKIAVAYHKGIQELEVPTSKKITNKVMNSSIVKTLKKARS